ncbi:hypothetical protein PSTT_11513 [Puccinia striiformis]|uniref:Uncharacterized protein n=1 Tax=Puccinia striiformis TaxID=27350 RepID=A0A2S4V051_9BASI|nr:hypothetical protein PSTT_11513 [Puccinia striiformis]
MSESDRPSDERSDQRYWHLGDLVTYGLRRLRQKYDPTTNGQLDQTSAGELVSALSASEVESQQDLLNELQSRLLPALQYQITVLSLSLDPSRIQKDPAKNLNIALKVQLELDYTLDQLRSAVATVCRGPAITTNRSDDHHLKSLKSYRLHHLKTKLLSLYQRLCDTFVLASELIQQMGFTSELPKNLHQTDVLRRCLDEPVHIASACIKTSIDWLNASDLHIGQDSWEPFFSFMEDPLKDLISRLNPLTDLTDENQEPTIKYVREPVIQLAKLAVPIIKLIRIFYNKLSEGGLNRERLPRYTEMCSNQIESLSKSPDGLCIDIRDIVVLLDLANLNRAGVLPMAFLDVTNRLKTRFESPMFLLLLYCIPLIPDNDGLNIQNYYKDWCITWHNQLNLAIHNFECVAKTFDINP